MPVDAYVKKTVGCVGGEELYKKIGYLVSYLYSYTGPQVFVPTKYSWYNIHYHILTYDMYDFAYVIQMVMASPYHSHVIIMPNHMGV